MSYITVVKQNALVAVIKQNVSESASILLDVQNQNLLESSCSLYRLILVFASCIRLSEIKCAARNSVWYCL